MKRIAILLSFLLLSVAAIAQDHASFKGIPINGTLDSFTAKLKAQGFTFVDSQSGLSLLTGTFAGKPDTRIYVVSTNNLVWKVAVEFQSQDTWVANLKQYNELKDAFSKKYQVEPGVEETFPEGFKGSPDDSYSNSRDMFEALEKENAFWESAFDIPGGIAVLHIKPAFNTYSKFQVAIEYYDTVNTKARDNAVINDI